VQVEGLQVQVECLQVQVECLRVQAEALRVLVSVSQLRAAAFAWRGFASKMNPGRYTYEAKMLHPKPFAHPAKRRSLAGKS